MPDFITKFSDSEEISVNITSMIDVIFILLIFFMVSTQFKKNSLPLNLPSSENTHQEESDSKVNVLSITNDSIYLNDASVEYENLYKTLVSEYKKNPEATLSFECENSVSFQRVVEIITQIQKAGIEKIGIAHDLPE